MYKSVKRLLSVALFCAAASFLVLIMVSPSYSGLGPALPAQDLTLTPWAYLPLVAREPTPTPDPPVIEITYIYVHQGILPANYEYVVISNTGGSAQNMLNWRLTDHGPEYVFFFPGAPDFPGGFTLQPGASVKVYTRSGNNNQEELFWKNGTRIWDKGGDTAYLYNQNGDLVDTYAY